MALLHLYRAPGLSPARSNALLLAARKRISPDIRDIETEFCFNIEAAGRQSRGDLEALAWLLRETFQPEGFGLRSSLDGDREILEVGPRMNFTTAWSTNAVSICHACGLTKVRRIEQGKLQRHTHTHTHTRVYC